MSLKLHIVLQKDAKKCIEYTRSEDNANNVYVYIDRNNIENGVKNLHTYCCIAKNIQVHIPDASNCEHHQELKNLLMDLFIPSRFPVYQEGERLSITN